LDERLRIFSIVLIIFLTGFLFRVETSKLHDLSVDEKAYLTDEHGLPYMYELDSYYNYRVSRNYLMNGHLGDSLRDGVPWDSYSYYPPGRPASYPPVIAWVSTRVYRVLSIFMDISFYETCFWLPAVIAPFAGIAMFFLLRKYSGDLAGFIGGVMTVTAPLYFSRTLPGFFDTDMFNILIPVMIVFFLTEAVEAEDRKRSLFCIVLSSLLILLFSLSWRGWPYILYIIAVSCILYLSWRAIGGKDWSFPAIMFSVLFLLSITFCGLLNAWSDVIHIINPLNIMNSTSATGGWPDVYLSVSELSRPSFEIFVSAAGPLNLGFGVLGLIMITSVMLRPPMRDKHLGGFNVFIFIFSILWMAVSLLAYYSSVRFSILAIPPLTFISGVFLGLVFSYMGEVESWMSLMGHGAGTIMVAIISLLVLSVSVVQASEITMKPFINDDYESAAAWIHDETPPETVIVTDWSYGHYFTAASGRPVLFDGGSQNTKRAYWIFKAFATDNETLSLGILTMLTASGDRAIDLLENYTGNTADTAEILNGILCVDRETAAGLLTDEYGMGHEFTDELLSATHAERRPFIILTTEGMKYAGYWYFYFGDWNFTSKNTIPVYHVETVDVSQIDRSLKRGLWDGKRPHSFIISDDRGIETISVDNSSKFSVIFLPAEGKAFIIDSSFNDSLFVKLVLLGEETEHFRKIYQKGDVTVWGVR